MPAKFSRRGSFNVSWKKFRRHSSVIPGMDHAHPEKSMKLLMQSRHLAPVYGGKTMLSPENRDYLAIDRVPDIFHAGHIHVLGDCNYRGVLVVNSGGWQEQTDYMEKLGWFRRQEKFQW